jgi:hypothetical protein
MKIIELTAENVKRLKAVRIKPDGHVQIVGGRNAQGKTSVLDAIWLALGGGAASKGTVQPIRDGEDHAMVELDLGELLVTRHWEGDKTTLRVESGGARYPSPQAMLNALVGRLSFDPLEFTRLSGREQLAALLELVDLDIDLDAIAAERGQLYEQRTEIGREGKRLDGHLATLGRVEDAPAAEESASQLISEMRAAEALIQRQQADVFDRGAWGHKIDALEDQLAEARAELAKAEERIAGHQPTPDVKALEERLDQVEATNAAVRRNAERAQVGQDLTKHRAAYEQLTYEINELDQRKAAALAAAQFPVDGLGFDEQGVTFHGIPFSQASAAEQIRVSLGMAMALNPKLRVIRILDGSLLDGDNLALIEEMAKANDYQIWVERVGDADAAAVIIEDGEVRK